MRKQLYLWTMLAALVVFAGCAGDAAKKEAQVEDRSAGAGTAGAGTAAGVSGEAIDQALLSERRVYFAFDSSSLDGEATAIIEAHAQYLVNNPGIKVTLEGHTDERGTREYNLALGERRAQAVARMMRVLGVEGGRINTISYGEEKPVDTEHNEAAWRQNRRVEIVY